MSGVGLQMDTPGGNVVGIAGTKPNKGPAMITTFKVSLLLILLAGCGTSAVPTGATSGPADTKADAVASPPDVALATDAPTRSPACGKFDDGVYGQKHPWSGFVQDGKTYTCNECRGGYPGDQGTWRLIDFATENPSTSLGDFRETLTFDGNTWRDHLAGDDLGKQVDAMVDGWFWCADTSELTSGNAVFIVDSVKPEGAFGWQSGMVFSGDIKSNGKDLRALGLFTGFEGGKHNEWLYCRVGSTISGVPCSDPFQK